MAHHGTGVPEDLARQMEEFQEKFKLGATGDFPQGKIVRDDEGELRIGIGEHAGKVILHFGGPVRWVGFDPEQARVLGEALIARAAAIERKGDE